MTNPFSVQPKRRFATTATSLMALPLFRLATTTPKVKAWTHPRPSLTLLSSSSPAFRLASAGSSLSDSRQHSLTAASLPILRQQRTLLAATSSTAAIPNKLAFILETIEKDSLPLLHIGNRVGSGSYGTVHHCFLVLPKGDGISSSENNSNSIYDVERKYNILPCIAKRPWTFPELEARVPAQVQKLERLQKQQKLQQPRAVAQKTGLASVKRGLSVKSSQQDNESKEEVYLSPSELKLRAERCKHYWEVERHCLQKLEKRKQQQSEQEMNRNEGNNNYLGRRNAVPAFVGVFQDDGSGTRGGATLLYDEKNASETVPGYGLLGEEDLRRSLQSGGGAGSSGWFSINGNSGAGMNGGNRERPGRGHYWMVFEFVGSAMDGSSNILSRDMGGAADETALTLLDAMEVSVLLGKKIDLCLVSFIKFNLFCHSKNALSQFFHTQRL